MILCRTFLVTLATRFTIMVMVVGQLVVRAPLTVRMVNSVILRVLRQDSRCEGRCRTR